MQSLRPFQKKKKPLHDKSLSICMNMFVYKLKVYFFKKNLKQPQVFAIHLNVAFTINVIKLAFKYAC